VHASLTRLDTARDDLARRWLARVVERSTLDEVAALSTERIARELPTLVSAVVRAASEPDEGPRLAGVERAAELLSEIRGPEASDPSALARDAATLESVMAEALAGADARGALDALERVAAVLLAALGEAIAAGQADRVEALERRSGLDPGTGALDAASLRRQLSQLVAIQQRYGHPFALLVIDLEGLRRINDAHGRDTGDRALAGVAATVRGAVRAADSVGRLGGDELCVLAPHQVAAGGRTIGERLAEAVGQLDDEPVGVSIGVVACPEHGVDPERLLELADEAMYRCKAAGTAVEVADAPLARAAEGGEG
jgi:diguanylate cyclase (GGDEF)-like protein